MQLAEVKPFVGRRCIITWRDRSGKECETTSLIYDATFVPLYGSYLITETDEIQLDRVLHIQPVEDPVTGQNPSRPLAA
ncbi:MAG: hypothetical protein RMJ43_12425 [Chloroherpetonaceae bacterium]|nr:hypothetical protein [Chthonomonadaceae bacterium]MDW8208634.1 hypothetical protein [Chloroherpetonaceae bacterium]